MAQPRAGALGCYGNSFLVVAEGISFGVTTPQLLAVLDRNSHEIWHLTLDVELATSRKEGSPMRCFLGDSLEAALLTGNFSFAGSFQPLGE